MAQVVPDVSPRSQPIVPPLMPPQSPAFSPIMQAPPPFFTPPPPFPQQSPLYQEPPRDPRKRKVEQALQTFQDSQGYHSIFKIYRSLHSFDIDTSASLKLISQPLMQPMQERSR